MLKARFYAAYAYNYAGENLLAEDKCGEAIRALQESQKCESESRTVFLIKHAISIYLT